MPTYTVHAPHGSLCVEKKRRLAREITRVHHETTGAQRFFAQVMFVDVPADQWFVGGAAMTGEQIFIHGQIRGGRPLPMKQALLNRLIDVAVEQSGVPRNRIWAYLVELPPSVMAEYGHILPEPGSEAQWLAGLPGEDRAVMEATGARP
jgi:phenylpyruvate tautomerase PptA (4-oxalocrotonate tautomerase family)